MNSGREHLAITRMFMCVVVVILFDFVFLVLFVLPPCSMYDWLVVCVLCGVVSVQGRMVDALASRADEGRGNLR